MLADSLTAESGRCTAVCGHIVLPASLASPPGAGCVLCEEASGSPRRAVRRRSWIGFMRTPRSA
ncbi:hypothetical protein [Pseudonocardia sp. HH130630-07]|uniref:hypothetical protein n=1 Tax=Pseudonocardia sp. HH130630-07 TaxID=1690815 RepID=UPI00081539F8|nr:hypothetical protein [Pseudonocardia sp. HH130630-07]ANY07110.1 hypothetical protein AFB00_13345 [Pseudonocardia sp. HH130630-07]